MDPNMDCKKALKLVDARPFTDSAQQDALEQHLSGCTTCRAASETLEALEIAWHRLPEPEPKVDLTSAILSSIEQQATGSSALGEERNLSVPEPDTEERALLSRPLAWFALASGLAFSIGAQIYGLITGESTLNLGAPLAGGGLEGLSTMPQIGPAFLALAVGLLLYVLGLFASLPEPELE